MVTLSQCVTTSEGKRFALSVGFASLSCKVNIAMVHSFRFFWEKCLKFVVC